MKALPGERGRPWRGILDLTFFTACPVLSGEATCTGRGGEITSGGSCACSCLGKRNGKEWGLRRGKRKASRGGLEPPTY